MSGLNISNCDLCNDAVDLHIYPDIILGSNDILIIGESPKGALVDAFGSLTMKRLSQELETCGVALRECHFTELCKCQLSNRKYFKKVATNCVANLEKQISELKPKLIISIGITTKEVIEGHYRATFAIGELKKINDFYYLPLYHPSPANPHGHKKNLEILKKIDLTSKL